MKNLVWSPTFIRAFKRLVKKNPELRSQIEQVLQQIAEDPFQLSLRSHKLKGDSSLIIGIGFYLNLLQILNQKRKKFCC